MNAKIKQIVLLGVMVALEIVLSRFLSISTLYVKIGFAFLPVAIAGMLYGPVWGGVVGAMSDIIGALLFPIGAFFPGFTLSAFLRGVVYGLFLYGMKTGRKTRLLPLQGAAAVVCIGINFGLDSYWLYVMMGEALMGMLPARAINSGVMLVVQPLLLLLIATIGKPVIEPIYETQRALLRQTARGLFAGENGAELRAKMSERISNKICALPQYRRAGTVFCFVGTQREVDTTAILTDALASGKVVCVPRCESDGVMTARRIRSLADLTETGSFGIAEPPKTSETILPETIDFAVVPASATDWRRGRIGKGGGFYDRYLDNMDMYKAAVCPSALFVWRLPLCSTDIMMDTVITERE